MASILEDAPLSISVAQAAALLVEHYGLSGDVEPLIGDRDRNFVVRSRADQWMLKIAHPAERIEALQAQQEILSHCRLWDPDLPIAVPVPTREGSLVGMADLAGTAAPIRLTTFLPGTTVEESGWNLQLRQDSIAVLARLDLALRSFGAVVVSAPREWQVDRLSELRTRINHLPPGRQRLATGWLDYFERHVAERLGELRTQAIHGDFNPANIIVSPDEPELVAGVIDFGDIAVAPLVADPAIAAAYQCLGGTDPVATIATAAAGFNRVVPLTAAEIELFGPLAIGRLVQSLIISSWRASLHPDNSSYILLHAEPVWATLQRLDTDRPNLLVAEVAAACAARTAAERTTDEVLAARRSLLSPGMRLTYDKPLRIRSGRGVWLTDSDGVRHLDAYNNVAHVGHGHPDVVAALSGQAGRLNTNTRYLVDEVTDYADRLTSLLPPSLDVVFFANSGSEANDLAWRIARTVTGRKGMVVTEHAYHGSTELTLNTSPEELGKENLPPWVATTPAPCHAATGSHGVRAAVESLAASGHEIAAFACDTVFSSDGIYDIPSGFLEDVYRVVRESGGLCIADEVQAGFGRVGTRFWGFAAGAAVPDIVTLGKPMGNGHPIAAVITSAEIAEEFSRSAYYFSTFAGNPVSAAVGGAVLDVMERERLPEQAETVGDYIRRGLVAVAAEHEIDAVVRGPGLFVGFEIRDEEGQPDSKTASVVQNQMRESRVLIGRTGVHGNVLKIRPPLVFTETHGDILLATLRDVLGSLAH